MPELRGLMMIQVPVSDPLSGHDVHWLMIGVIIIAVALVLQSVGLIAAALMAAKMLQKVAHLSDTVEESVMPIVRKTNSLVDELGPKVRSISTNVEQISYTVRAKTEEIGETVAQLSRTVADLNLKTRTHVAHVDGIVTEALNTAEEVSVAVQHGIRVPVKQIAGLVAGLKAGLETLVAKSPFGKGRDVRSPYDL
jgi:uncharacterized protein YoxC